MIAAFRSDAGPEGEPKTAVNKPFYRNLFSVAPYQPTDMADYGIGIQYEHFLSPKASLYLPVAFCFLKDYHDPTIKGQYTYLYPGVKFYPFGSQHLFSYSVGPSLALGFGEEIISPHDPVNGVVPPASVEKTDGMLAGLMVNNGLNIRPGRYYFGSEIGFGYSFQNNTNTVFNNYGLLVQFQAKAGIFF